jgi:glycosyltransferase involved in cell wall biosynthesis
VAPEDLRWVLSAADVFVLATRNEGWANVLLEAMACGLPVVATDVGGNAEVVADPSLGRLVPFGDPPALARGLEEALSGRWDGRTIRAWAVANRWEARVEALIGEFRALSGDCVRTQG